MMKFSVLALIVTMIIAFSITSTVFADGDREFELTMPLSEETSLSTTENIETEIPVETNPFTPEGNLTLVDDFQGDETQNKQFITVQSKAGNYFYLVIDRNGDRENVYFLNLVDEADLLSLIEENPNEELVESSENITTSTNSSETNIEVSNDTDLEENGISLGAIILFVVMAIGVGLFYYFKILKPKRGENGKIVLDELDYDDDDE